MMMTEAYEEMVFREGYRRGYEKGKADRPKGEWIESVYDLMCSNCENTQEYEKFPYCPYCGADMRGEDNETD